jgi:hypothetical protein
MLVLCSAYEAAGGHGTGGGSGGKWCDVCCPVTAAWPPCCGCVRWLWATVMQAAKCRAVLPTAVLPPLQGVPGWGRGHGLVPLPVLLAAAAAAAEGSRLLCPVHSRTDNGVSSTAGRAWAAGCTDMRSASKLWCTWQQGLHTTQSAACWCSQHATMCALVLLLVQHNTPGRTTG